MWLSWRLRSERSCLQIHEKLCNVSGGNVAKITTTYTRKQRERERSEINPIGCLPGDMKQSAEVALKVQCVGAEMKCDIHYFIIHNYVLTGV